jgi:Na+/proline symporter
VIDMPVSVKAGLMVAQVVFWAIAMLEAMVFLGFAYYALHPDTFDFLNENDDSPHIVAAIAYAGIAAVIALGVIAACVPQIPLRKALLGASALTVVLINLAWAATAL